MALMVITSPSTSAEPLRTQPVSVLVISAEALMMDAPSISRKERPKLAFAALESKVMRMMPESTLSEYTIRSTAQELTVPVASEPMTASTRKPLPLPMPEPSTRLREVV